MRRTIDFVSPAIYPFFRTVLVTGALLIPTTLSPAMAATDRATCAKESGEAAIAACSRAIASGRYRGRDLAELHFNRAVEYGDSRDDANAIADLSESIRLYPYSAAAFFNRAKIWRRKGENDRALADYSEAIRLDPTNPEAYNNRGNILAQQGKTDRALADYDQAIRLHPKYAAAFFNRALLSATKGDQDRALADYSESLRLDPTEADAYNNRGNILLDQGKIERALADYNEAIRLNRKTPCSTATVRSPSKPKARQPGRSWT